MKRPLNCGNADQGLFSFVTCAGSHGGLRAGTRGCRRVPSERPGGRRTPGGSPASCVPGPWQVGCGRPWPRPASAGCFGMVRAWPQPDPYGVAPARTAPDCTPHRTRPTTSRPTGTGCRPGGQRACGGGPEPGGEAATAPPRRPGPARSPPPTAPPSAAASAAGGAPRAADGRSPAGSRSRAARTRRCVSEPASRPPHPGRETQRPPVRADRGPYCRQGLSTTCSRRGSSCTRRCRRGCRSPSSGSRCPCRCSRRTTCGPGTGWPRCCCPCRCGR
jgi:hypothetical protein